jgi:hypothetical protein
MNLENEEWDSRYFGLINELAKKSNPSKGSNPSSSARFSGIMTL